MMPEDVFKSSGIISNNSGAMYCVALIGNDDPLRKFRQLTKAEFDDDLFVLSQLHSFDQADQ